MLLDTAIIDMNAMPYNYEHNQVKCVHTSPPLSSGCWKNEDGILIKVEAGDPRI